MVTCTWQDAVRPGEIQDQTEKRKRFLVALAGIHSLGLVWRVEYTFRPDLTVHLHFHTLQSRAGVYQFKRDFDSVLNRYCEVEEVRSLREVVKYLSPTYSYNLGLLAGQTHRLHTYGTKNVLLNKMRSLDYVPKSNDGSSAHHHQAGRRKSSASSSVLQEKRPDVEQKLAHGVGPGSANAVLGRVAAD